MHIIYRYRKYLFSMKNNITHIQPSTIGGPTGGLKCTSINLTEINKKQEQMWIWLNASLPLRKLLTYLIKLGEKRSSHACSCSSFSLPSSLFISNVNRKSMWSSLASPSLTSPSGRKLTSLGATSNPSQLFGFGFFVFVGLRKHIYINDCHILCQLLTLFSSPVGACFSFLAASDWSWPSLG